MRHATFGNENSFIFFTSFFPSTSWSEYAQIWLTRNTCQHIICIVFTSEQFGISKQYLQILQCNILLLCKLVIDVRFCWNPSMQKEAPNLWSSWKWKKKRKKRCSTYGYFFTWWKMASGKNVVCTIQWAVSTECTQNRTLHNCASSFSIMYHYFVFSLFWIYLRLFLLFTTVHYVTLPTLIFRSEWVSEWERSHVCALFHFTFGWCVRFFDLRRRDAIYRLNFLFSCKLLLRTFYSVNQCVVFFFVLFFHGFSYTNILIVLLVIHRPTSVPFSISQEREQINLSWMWRMPIQRKATNRSSEVLERHIRHDMKLKVSFAHNNGTIRDWIVRTTNAMQ